MSPPHGSGQPQVPPSPPALCTMAPRGVPLGNPRNLLGTSGAFGEKRPILSKVHLLFLPSCFQPDLPAQPCLFPAPSPARFVQFSPKLPVNFPPRSEPSSLFGRGRGTRLWFSSFRLFLPVQRWWGCARVGARPCPLLLWDPRGHGSQKAATVPRRPEVPLPSSLWAESSLVYWRGRGKKSKFGKSRG